MSLSSKERELMSHLKDRVIMITRAGSGFGALLAERSLAQDAKVMAVDLS